MKKRLNEFVSNITAHKKVIVFLGGFSFNNSDTSDGLLRPFCYVIYFDENQKSVYVKLISDNRGG